jgi:hypothetical protein
LPYQKKKGFRHNSYENGNKVRVKKFREALAAVREGRANYLQDAIKLRMERKVQDCNDLDGTDSDDACILEETDL